MQYEREDKTPFCKERESKITNILQAPKIVWAPKSNKKLSRGMNVDGDRPSFRCRKILFENGDDEEYESSFTDSDVAKSDEDKDDGSMSNIIC